MYKRILPVLLAFLSISCSSWNREYCSVTEFLDDRGEVREYITKSFAQCPEGATLSSISESARGMTSSSIEKKSRNVRFNSNFPGDEHIRKVVKNRHWMNQSNYILSLDLNDSMLSSANQNNSETMTGTQLLDFYFSGLSELGYRNQGSPSCLLMDHIQYAGNVWFKEGSNNISIFGDVYVSLKEKKAVIVVKISERY